MRNWELIEANVRDRQELLTEHVQFQSYLPIVIVLSITCLAFFVFRLRFSGLLPRTRAQVSSLFFLLSFVTLAWFQGCSSGGRSPVGPQEFLPQSKDIVLMQTVVGERDYAVDLRPGEEITRTLWGPTEIAILKEKPSFRALWLDNHPSVPERFFKVENNGSTKKLTLQVSEASRNGTSVFGFQTNKNREYSFVVHGPQSVARIFHRFRLNSSEEDAIDQTAALLRTQVEFESSSNSLSSAKDLKVYRQDGPRANRELLFKEPLLPVQSAEVNNARALSELPPQIADTTFDDSPLLPSPLTANLIEQFSQSFSEEDVVEDREPHYPPISNYVEALRYSKIILWNGFSPAESQLQRLYTWSFSAMPRPESFYCSYDSEALGCEAMQSGLPLLGSNPSDNFSFWISRNPVFTSVDPIKGLGGSPKVGRGIFFNASSPSDMTYSNPRHIFRRADDEPSDFLNLLTDFYSTGLDQGLAVGGAYVLGKVLKTSQSAIPTDVNSAPTSGPAVDRTAYFQNLSAGGGVSNFKEKNIYVGLISVSNGARAEAILQEFREAFRQVSKIPTNGMNYRFAPPILAELKKYTGEVGEPFSSQKYGLGLTELAADEECSPSSNGSAFAEAQMPEIPANLRFSNAQYVRCLHKIESGSTPKPRAVFSWMSDPRKFVFAQPEGGGITLYFNLASEVSYTTGSGNQARSVRFKVNPWTIFWILKLRKSNPALFNPKTSIAESVVDTKLSLYPESRSLYPSVLNTGFSNSTRSLESFGPEEFLLKSEKLSQVFAFNIPESEDSKLRPKFLKRISGDRSPAGLNSIARGENQLNGWSWYEVKGPTDGDIAQFQVGTNEVAEYRYRSNEATEFPNGKIIKKKAHLITCGASALGQGNTLENWMDADFNPQFFDANLGSIRFGWTQSSQSSCGGGPTPRQVYVGWCRAAQPLPNNCPATPITLPEPVTSTSQGGAGISCPFGSSAQVSIAQSGIACDTSAANVVGIASDINCPRIPIGSPPFCNSPSCQQTETQNNLLCRRLGNVTCDREFNGFVANPTPHPSEAGFWPLDLSGYNDSIQPSNFVQCPGSNSLSIIKQPEYQNCCTKMTCNGTQRVIDSGLKETGNYEFVVWAAPEANVTCQNIAEVADHYLETPADFNWNELVYPATRNSEDYKTFRAADVWAARQTVLQSLLNDPDAQITREVQKTIMLLSLYANALQSDPFRHLDLQQAQQLQSLVSYTNPVTFYNSHSHMSSTESLYPEQDQKLAMHLGFGASTLSASGGIESAIQQIGWTPQYGPSVRTSGNRTHDDNLYIWSENRSIGEGWASKRSLQLAQKIQEAFEFADGLPHSLIRVGSVGNQAFLPNLSQATYVSGVDGGGSRTRLTRGPTVLANFQSGVMDEDPIGTNLRYWRPESGTPNKKKPKYIAKTKENPTATEFVETVSVEAAVDTPSRQVIAPRQSRYFEDARGTNVGLREISWPQIESLVGARTKFKNFEIAQRHLNEPEPAQRYHENDYCIADSECTGRFVMGANNQCVCPMGMAPSSETGDCECLGNHRVYQSGSCVCGPLTEPVPSDDGSTSLDCACVSESPDIDNDVSAVPRGDDSPGCACPAGSHQEGNRCIADGDDDGGGGGTGGGGSCGGWCSGQDPWWAEDAPPNGRWVCGIRCSPGRYVCPPPGVPNPCSGGGGGGGGGDDGGGPGQVCQGLTDNCQCGGCCDRLGSPVIASMTAGSPSYSIGTATVVGNGRSVSVTVSSDRLSENYQAIVVRSPTGDSLPSEVLGDEIATFTGGNGVSRSFHTGAMSTITMENGEYRREASFSFTANGGRIRTFATGLNILGNPQAGNSTRVSGDIVVDDRPPSFNVAFDLGWEDIFEQGLNGTVYVLGAIPFRIQSHDPISAEFPSQGRSYSGDFCVVHSTDQNDPILTNPTFAKEQCEANAENTIKRHFNYNGPRLNTDEMTVSPESLLNGGSWFRLIMYNGRDMFNNQQTGVVSSNIRHFETLVNNCNLYPESVQDYCAPCGEGEICRSRPPGITNYNYSPPRTEYPEGFWNAWFQHPPDGCWTPNEEPPVNQEIDEFLRYPCVMTSDRVIDFTSGRLRQETCDDIAAISQPPVIYPDRWIRRRGACVITDMTVPTSCQAQCLFWDETHWTGTGPGDGGPPQVCANDTDCPANFICEAQMGGNKICVPGNRQCDENSDCSTGQHCDTQYGVCVNDDTGAYCGPSACSGNQSCQMCNGNSICTSPPSGGGSGGSGSSGYAGRNSSAPPTPPSTGCSWNSNSCQWNCGGGGGTGPSNPSKKESTIIPGVSD